jgi:hypothetical protein
MAYHSMMPTATPVSSGTEATHCLGDHGDFDAARTRAATHSNEPRSGSDLTMSKADAADSDSTVRKHRQRGLIPWKPGQSGNPKGRPEAVEFVRLVASLMPKEPEATITPVVMERMSDAQLDAMIARCIEGGLDPASDG